jgi:hypothetical protein
MGIIIGESGNQVSSPFSAPFGGFSSVDKNPKIDIVEKSLIALINWVHKKGFKTLNITLPPDFYNRNLTSKIQNSLYRLGFQQDRLDLNYQFHLLKFNETYLSDCIWYNARKNYLRSTSFDDLNFTKLDELEQKTAYDVISENRKEKGYPLRMTWEQVQKTNEVVTIDYFLVSKGVTPIGAAITFHVSQEVVLVVYWGDISAYSECKTMNYLSYNLFKYYSQTNIQIVDIGPSTENSIPNLGLCDFKESIGCDVSTKLSFSYTCI